MNNVEDLLPISFDRYTGCPKKTQLGYEARGRSERLREMGTKLSCVMLLMGEYICMFFEIEHFF